MKKTYSRPLCIILACFISVMGFGSFQITALAAMGTSNNGVELIKQFEGCRLTAYKALSSEEYYTIGYGHYGADVYSGMTITQAQAENMLRSDLVKYEGYVNNFLNKNGISVNQNQFDALVSFTYNLGNVWVSTPEFKLKTYLINGVSNYNVSEITTAFTNWSKAGGQTLSGLLKRRNAEAQLFLKSSNFPGNKIEGYNYPLNVTAKYHDNTYDSSGNMETNRWIDAGDKCTVYAVYESGYVLVDYPTSNGTRRAYAKKELFPLQIPPVPPENIYDLPAYVTAKYHDNTYDSNGNIESNRWIDAGDKCTVYTVYQNGFVLVDYPTSNGMRSAYAKKELFDIPLKKEFPGKEVEGYSLPVNIKAKYHDNTYDSNGNKETNRWIDAGDECTIYAVYESGYVFVDYPTSSGTRRAYAKKDLFDIYLIHTHSWSSWTTFRYPTLSEAGEQTRKCSVCGKTEIQAIPKLTTVTTKQITTTTTTTTLITTIATKQTVATEPQKENIIKGDVNSDGLVNLKDVVILRRYIVGDRISAVNETNADMNNDGRINLKDVVLIRMYLVGDGAENKLYYSTEIYGKSENSRNLVCHSISPKSYDKTILLNFAIHGFEDDYDADGQVLVDTANYLIDHYKKSQNLNCRVLIVPCANPDGLLDGFTNNGFGRCNAKGIDLNRDFDANYAVNNTKGRNYTPGAFSASESRALRDLVNKYDPSIVLDFHGWLNCTIGDSELAEVFYSEMGLSHQVSFTSANARGYFSNWTHQQGSLGLLVEFKNTQIDRTALVNAVDRLINNDYDNGKGKYAADTSFEKFGDISGYTLSSGRVTTYQFFDTPFKGASYIDGSTDLCTIHKIYANGWVKVEYPVSGGTKIAYCHLSDFVDPACASAHYQANTDVYTRSDMDTKIGSVWTSDRFTVIAKKGTALQIIYPLDNGGYKIGWINENTVV